MSTAEQAQLRILKIIEADPEISQRQLAEVMGVSLGKTNYLIKALLVKGHIKAGNFLRAVNKLKYAYLRNTASHQGHGDANSVAVASLF